MKPQRLMLIGCGRIARKHLKAIRFAEKKKWARLVALVDPRIDQAIALGTEFSYPCERFRSQEDQPGEAKESEKEKHHSQEKKPGEERKPGQEKKSEKLVGPLPSLATNDPKKVQVFASYEEALAQMKPDVAVICTGSGLHYIQAKTCLEAGCHLLVEKPLSLFAREAKNLVDLGEKYHKKIAVGHIYRYFPSATILARDLANGFFGQIYYAQLSMRWGHEAAYYSASPWQGKRETSGGALMNQCVHGVDLLYWLLGKPNLVSCQASLTRLTQPMECEDLAFVTYRFAPDTYAQVEATTVTDPAYHEAQLFLAGSGGEVRLSLAKNRLNYEILRDGKKRQWAYLTRYLKEVVDRYGLGILGHISNPHTFILLDLLEAIAEDRDPIASGLDGFRSVDLVEAAYEASGFYADSQKGEGAAGSPGAAVTAGDQGTAGNQESN